MSESNSEALRLLRNVRARAAPDSTWVQMSVIEIDALLARPDGPEPCSIEGMIASERARADKDNAAGQERQPSDQGRVNAVRSPQAATTPAPAAPAEALTLTTDAVIGTIRFVAVKTGVSATTVGAICHDVRSIVGDLERRFHAALSRERQLERELAGAEGRIREIEEDYDNLSGQVAAAVDDERLANMRHAEALGWLEDARRDLVKANMLADQAEKARGAAQSASGALRWVPCEPTRAMERAGMLRAEQSDVFGGVRALTYADCAKIYRAMLEAAPFQQPSVPVASTSERKGK